MFISGSALTHGSCTYQNTHIYKHRFLTNFFLTTKNTTCVGSNE